MLRRHPAMCCCVDLRVDQESRERLVSVFAVLIFERLCGSRCVKAERPPFIWCRPSRRLPLSVQDTKSKLRGDFAAEWARYAETEVDGAWELLSSGPVKAQLAGVLERLSGGKKKADPQSRL